MDNGQFLSVDTAASGNGSGGNTSPVSPRRGSFARRLSLAVRSAVPASAPVTPVTGHMHSASTGHMFSAMHTSGWDNLSMSLDINDYLIHRPIGYGSSAVVYLATYKPLKKQVAIKTLDLDMFERDQIEELRRELQIMTLSKHPNILPVNGAFVSGSKLYIVMPFMAAGSCLDILRTAYPEGIEEACIATILKSALLALDYLHKNGHIHRDVKAGNLVMDGDGVVQLADFGVSSSLLDSGDRKKKRRTFVGTPCWMAPEVLTPEKGYDYKADIWSFGITALELANGQAPYAKYPPMKVLMLTMSREPPKLNRDGGKYKYSKGLKEMIEMCLVKDPTKRPSAEKLLQHSFFKQAKKPDYLVRTLLHDLPPVNVRPIRKPTTSAKPVVVPDYWDFSSSNSGADDASSSTADANSRLDRSCSRSSSATSDTTRAELQSVDEESVVSSTVTDGSSSDRPRRSTIGSSRPVRRGRFHVHTGSLDLGSSGVMSLAAGSPTADMATGRASVDLSAGLGGVLPLQQPQMPPTPPADVIQSRKGRFDVVHTDDSAARKKAAARASRVRFASISSDVSALSSSGSTPTTPDAEIKISEKINGLLLSGEQRQQELEDLARDIDVTVIGPGQVRMERRTSTSSSLNDSSVQRARSQSMELFIRENEMLRRENASLEEENMRLRSKLLQTARPEDC